MNEREIEYAKMEAARNESWESYSKAFHNGMPPGSERVFDYAFSRGWDRKALQAEIDNETKK